MGKSERTKEPQTAEEVMADPKVAAAHREMLERLELLEEQDRIEELPLTDDLRSVGIDVDSVWDLVNRQYLDYEEGLPVLADHLKRDYSPGTLDGIARALAVPHGAFAFEQLRDMYVEELDLEPKAVPPREGLRQALAVALSETVTPAVEDDYLELFERSLLDGRYAVLLIDGLATLRTPRATALLRRLQRDPELGEAARKCLRKL